MAILGWLLFGALANTIIAFPYNKARRQITELRGDCEYDFVVVGGGTSGLTVADRLSEAFPDRNVLVIEYGVIEEASGINEPPGTPGTATTLPLPSEPMPELNNRSADLAVGMVVGGSSAINGQFFDRPCRYDMDDWRQIGSPEFDGSEDKWDWENVIPWFQKSVTFVEPDEALVDEYGFTWDYEAAYGGNTPIYSYFTPYQFPFDKVTRDALLEYGIAPRTECAAGDKDGLCWVPTSQHPETAKRSYAAIGHYQDVMEDRSNYDLLVGHKAMRLIVDSKSKEAPTVEFRSLSTSASDILTVKPKLEVIVSAGAIHTPQILQRSGIGHAAFLEELGIDVTVDLPGVGYNFQDHGGPGFQYNYTNGILPNQNSLLTNATFREESIELYTQRPAQGAYTVAMGNNAIYISLPHITPDYGDTVAAIRTQLSDDKAASLLPPGTPDTVIAGYKAQLELLAAAFENPEYPVLEAPFSSSAPVSAFLLKPLSRGTVMLNPDDHDAKPIITYRSLTNPIDMDLMVEFVSYFRGIYATEAIQALGPTEISPGANVTEVEDIKEWVRNAMVGSYMHPCCTAAMMPEEKGGVVGTDLKVHGLERVRVVDISVVPMLPGSHTSALAYAIGEKAADIIIRAWSKKKED
ncbi:hypothetical protein AJ79_03276 [Helicocarpus griseus UAMH5409]|uniref:Glucose-methanol-choline oxidoreductase N-terminal domain-containing protein n=1 Tax=Helicocarpus griseus UAMH5409 TaxID=1447875 RepID=A0A2B7XZV6_9EURO|nr:hypothetical protein AJ79_03276 [Helicocarpus griseus UAMH5409]